MLSKLKIALSAERLNFQKCSPLLDKIKKRLLGWKSKVPLYAGSAELIRCTLPTLQIYWASTYFLQNLFFILLIPTTLKDLFWNAVDLVWFKVCITNHSLCAWMIFKECLETKDFLLRINVSCDSCCVLCDCMWETAEHILLHCPHSKEFWGVLLHKLLPLSCALPTDMIESILSRVDANCKDLKALGKLIFSAYAWNCGEN